MLSFFKLIPTRLILSLLLLVSIYSVANYFIIKFLVSPGLLKVERTLAQQEMERFTEALLREEDALETISHDWSAWDDTYKFVQDSNQEFITSNLPDTTFTNSELNLLYIYRLDGSLVWNRVFDLETEDEIVLSELPPTGLPSKHPLLLHHDVNSAINGIVKTDQGPLIIAAHPIVTSENQGPIMGTLMFGRLLTRQLMAKLNKQTRVQCRLINLDNQNALAEIQIAIPSLGPATPFAFHESKDEILVYSLLYDYLANPAWLLEIHSERPITSQAREMLRYVLLSNTVIGFVTLILFLILYRIQLRAASSKFRGLIQNSLPPQAKKQTGHSLSFDFDIDEFSRLSDDLRTMIASFEQTSEQQKNIITHHTTSRRQLNAQMVKELKERLQIEEDLHKIQKDLEKLVEKRTSELRQTNAALHDEIEIRKENENELISHRQRLRTLSSELMEIEDKERRQLATELHDQIGQSLSAVKMYVDSLTSSTSNSDTRERLQLIAGIVDQTVQDVRTLTFELSPPILYELGLHEALEWLAEDFLEKHSLKITIGCDKCPHCTSPAFLALIFRTIRELLTNVVRHADADTAEIEVRCAGEAVRLIVKDNGCGMTNDPAKDSKNNSGGFGLFSIRERIVNIGGTVVIDSEKDKGTTITLTLPVKEVCSDSRS
jgi:signal transduction histidine kinase